MAKRDLSAEAYDILLKRIVANEYPPGFMLNELSLHSELNISRTPIHNAMVRLQQEDLVEILPKKGIRVTDITAETIRNIYDIRELIELYALRKFGNNFSKEKLLIYLKFFSREYSTVDYELVFEQDVQFHMDIVEQTHNKFLCSYYSSLKNQFNRLHNLSGLKGDKRVEVSNYEHTEILRAMLQDDIDKAVAGMQDHLRKACETAYNVIILKDMTSSEI